MTKRTASGLEILVPRRPYCAFEVWKLQQHLLYLSAELSEFLFLIFKGNNWKRQYIYGKSKKEK